MINTHTRSVVVAALLVLAAIGLVPGVASATEVVPGVDLRAATVTGPGISQPRPMSDQDGVAFLKAWIASSMFPPRVQKHPAGTRIYEVRIEESFRGAPGAATIRFAWDGEHGWFSGDKLLAKDRYIAAPPAAVKAMQSVLPAAGTIPAGPEASGDGGGSSSSSSSSTGLIVGVVAAVAVLGALVVGLRRRRSRRQGVDGASRV